MERPNEENDKYWGEKIKANTKVYQGTTIPFLHNIYEDDLNNYIDFLEEFIDAHHEEFEEWKKRIEYRKQLKYSRLNDTSTR